VDHYGKHQRRGKFGFDRMTKTLRMQHLRLQNLKKQVKAPIIEDNFDEDSDDSINEYENTEHNASDLSNENEEANNEAYETNDWVLVKYRFLNIYVGKILGISSNPEDEDGP
jgi:hypothetical protein